jgi:SAM-dependent methyltransferase
MIRPDGLMMWLGVALLFGSTGAPVVAQDHDHQITDFAKRLNESFADPDDEWAARLERDGREVADNRYAIIDQLGLRPGLDVADIGAGSGLFSRIVAQRVGPDGQVYAVDIAPNLVEHIAQTARDEGLDNLHAQLGDPRDPMLAENSVDRILIVDTYHHFEYPQEMLAHIKRALRPDGIFLLVEPHRIAGITPPPVMNMVRAGKGTFTDEVIDAGFELIDDIDLMESQYVLKFRHRPM